jgi:adenylate cyclase
MLDTLCEQPLIEKTRYHVRVGRHVWDIDEFDGQNRGLVVAEVELASADELFDRPSWLGREVTHDPRYLNANLIHRPFCTWATAADDRS